MKKRILMILGDFYHSHDMALEAMSKAASDLEKEFGYGLKLIDSSVDQLEQALEEKVDLVVLYKENRVNPTDEIVYNWMTHELEQKITEYVKNGGSWLAWHPGLASYDENGSYVEMLRGRFEFHPSEREVKFAYVENNVGINLKEAFEVMDEQYIVKCNPVKDSVFLISESSHGKSEAGWAHEYGRGRVCCLTPTHRIEGMTNDMMLDILKQCINWCCRS